MVSSTPHRVTFTAPRGAGRQRRRAAAVGAAAVVASFVWTVGVPIAGVDLTVRMAERTQDVGLGAVVAVSVLAGLLGWGLLALLETRSPRAADIWAGVAITTLAVSLVGPVTSAATSTAAAVLVTLHLSVGAVVIPVFRRTSRV